MNNNIAKLNIKEFQLGNHVYLVFITSNGYIICIESFCSKDYTKINYFIILYKIIDNNIIFIERVELFGWNPILIYELKNKSLLFTGRNHFSIYKIKDDKIFMSSYHGFSKGEIYQVKELENKRIILVNYCGEIFVAKELGKRLINYKQDENPIYVKYEIQETILNEEKEIHPILFTKGNIAFFNDFKIDFSSDKYQKTNINKIYEYKFGRKAYFGIFYESDKLVFALNSIKEKAYFNNKVNFPYDKTIGYELLIINKEYLEVVQKIELESVLTNLMLVEGNIFLYIMKDKIVMADFSDSIFKVIDSNNIESKKFNLFYIGKYSNQIYYFFNKLEI